MKPIILCILICASFSINAQDISYEHDNNGNRVLREVVVLKTATAGDNPSVVTNSTQLGDYSIKVFPNPTQGLVVMEISNLSPEDQGEIFVSTINGQLLDQFPIDSSGKLEVDLQDQPSGVYLVRMVLNDQSKIWKIVKE